MLHIHFRTLVQVIVFINYIVIHILITAVCRYSVTLDAGQGHLLLGKVSGSTELSDGEVAAVKHLCPSATLEGALVYFRVLVSGVVYTNQSYRQSSTNDYTLAFNDNTIGKAVKYLSLCSSSCMRTYTAHIVLVNVCQIHSNTRHIHRILDCSR